MTFDHRNENTLQWRFTRPSVGTRAEVDGRRGPLWASCVAITRFDRQTSSGCIQTLIFMKDNT